MEAFSSQPSRLPSLIDGFLRRFGFLRRRFLFSLLNQRLDVELKTVPFRIPQKLNGLNLGGLERYRGAFHPPNVIIVKVKPHSREEAMRLLAFYRRKSDTHRFFSGYTPMVGLFFAFLFRALLFRRLAFPPQQRDLFVGA